MHYQPPQNNAPQQLFRCPYCGLISKMVWVHGHGQCDNCKINVDECCRGEDAACRLLPENETH